MNSLLLAAVLAAGQSQGGVYDNWGYSGFGFADYGSYGAYGDPSWFYGYCNRPYYNGYGYTSYGSPGYGSGYGNGYGNGGYGNGYGYGNGGYGNGYGYGYPGSGYGYPGYGYSGYGNPGYGYNGYAPGYGTNPYGGAYGYRGTPYAPRPNGYYLGAPANGNGGGAGPFGMFYDNANYGSMGTMGTQGTGGGLGTLGSQGGNCLPGAYGANSPWGSYGGYGAWGSNGGCPPTVVPPPLPPPPPPTPKAPPCPIPTPPCPTPIPHTHPWRHATPSKGVYLYSMSGAAEALPNEPTIIRPAPLPQDAARITVMVPENARLFVNNHFIPSGPTGMRFFVTPSLQPGTEYFYTMRIEVPQGAQMLTESRQVDVRAGQQVTVNFFQNSNPRVVQR